MNHSTEEMLKEEIPKIRALLESMRSTQYPLAEADMGDEYYNDREQSPVEFRKLNPGVTYDPKADRYKLNGKMIKKSEAYE